MAKIKSILSEANQIQLAIQLIGLDARLQVLESETTLSRERLIRLYKEIKHKSPPKGMLPFSTDWFMTWQPSIHSSLFANYYESLIKASDIDESLALVKAYELYREQIQTLGLPEVLSMTRAWRLVKFFDAGMLTLAKCTTCAGRFVVHTYDLVDHYECGLCNMPSRAGKTKQDSATRFFNEEALLEA
ncbi:flagellar transcriptional regulator FlhC [Limnobacter litoralis]|uniref:Flagellar transcriptional regulator FlhC n=1 Tax=Limnobacter litoralis TaxID=481366 RepID=A0ABQ5YST2_9BURK|nr:flagellar transcriptional regulator FlhC [Limnobacter litoralis]GLR25849.1 flagellar transcriptional regulator FlhC [Limnobacter litoralis]